MNGDNVISASDRFARKQQQGAPAPIVAWKQLQSTVRTSEDDRIVLAERLGQAASRLNPSAPKKGAHAIMREAWGEDGSKKTGRLFVFEGKQKPTLLESSGASWARLIDAAARLIVTKDNQHPSMVDNAVRQQTARLLRGTSFLPQNAQGGAEPGAVGEVLQRLADKFVHRLQTNTRIFELWRILDGHPFTVEHVEGDEPTPASVVPHASQLANNVEWLMRRESGWKHYFVPVDPMKTWQEPWTADIFIPVGAFARQVQVKTFVPPPQVAEVFLGSSKTSAEMWDAYCAWRTGDEDIGDPIFPEYEYTDSLGHGAKEETITTLYFAYLRISSGADKRPVVTFQVNNDYVISCTAIPKLQDENMISYVISHARSEHLEVISDGIGDQVALVPHMSVRSLIDENYMRCGPVRIMNNEVGEQEEFCLRYSIDNFSYEQIFSIDGDSEEGRTLLYGAGDMRFIPSFAVEADKPTPTRPGSLADALLRNVDVAPEDQLVSIIEQHGKRIAEAGLAYHQALIDYYQEAIDRA